MTAERIPSVDRASLAAERGPVNMSVGGVLVADCGPGVTYDALRARIADRIHLLPRYRRRLEQPALGLANPVWVDDEHFDLDWHLRLSALPPPGGPVELAAFVGREFSRPLDRSRPLWELHLVEGLEGDRVAIVPKMHHALVDGVAAVGIATILLDTTPEPAPAPPGGAWSPRRHGLRDHLALLASAPLDRAQRLVLDGAERLLELSPRTAAADVLRATELVAALARRRPAPPRLPFNRPISPNRAYALASAPLDRLKAAAKAAGGTVNDAILAAVTGMLANYLADAGAGPTGIGRDPVALVPVSVRRPDDGPGGNRISVVLVDLPLAEPDPAARIGLIAGRTAQIKESADVAAGSFRIGLEGFAPPLLSSMLAMAGGDGGAFNLVVSNVPGPQFPLWLGGARVRAIHPVVPLNPADQGLNVGVLSYDGGVWFGLGADRALDPPVERAAAALDAALAAMLWG